MLIKWKINTLLECRDEYDNDWCEEITAGEEFEVENVELKYEDEENGDVVFLFLEDGVIGTTNSDWFKIID